MNLKSRVFLVLAVLTNGADNSCDNARLSKMHVVKYNGTEVNLSRKAAGKTLLLLCSKSLIKERLIKLRRRLLNDFSRVIPVRLYCFKMGMAQPYFRPKAVGKWSCLQVYTSGQRAD